MARSQFDLIQKMMNAEQGANIRFATITDYFTAVASEQKTFAVFEGDFVPYISDHPKRGFSFWTGFYSSRPGLKQKIVETHSLVRAAEIVSALVLKKEFQGYEACIGLHHNAITGTCTPEVASDYVERLNKDIQASGSAIRKAYSSIVTCSATSIDVPKPYKAFVIYNPINWIIEQVVNIATEFMYVSVFDSTGNSISSQSVPNLDNFDIYFKITLQPLSFTTVFMSTFNSSCMTCSASSRKSERKSISNKIYSIKFKKGLIQNVSIKDSEFQLEEKIVRYNASEGGQYELRPEVIHS